MITNDHKPVFDYDESDRKTFVRCVCGYGPIRTADQFLDHIRKETQNDVEMPKL